MTHSQTFRNHLEQSETLILPGVYDCLSARLAQKAGFEAVFTSGFGIAASTLGKPDYGYVTATEMLYSVGRMARAIEIPLIADMDTGYGNALNVMRTVEDAVQAGVSGVILEDQLWPKRCGHFDGKQVIDCQEQVQKIKAAVKARGDSGLVIVGRTDARAPLGLDAAIDRGKAYAEAGADIIFVEAPQSIEELDAIATALPDIHLFANMIEGGKTPGLTAQVLSDMGYKVVVYALSGLFAATRAIQDCLGHLRTHGTTQGYAPSLTFDEFAEVIEIDRYQALESEFLTDF